MLYPSQKTARIAVSERWTWPNFQIEELACRCGGRFCDGEYWHAPDFLDRLQNLRERVDRPVIINSGHRCRQWNAYVGGAPRSQHKQIAADISLRGHDRHQIYSCAQATGFRGFGLARSFLHLDLRPTRAVWYYNGSFDLWQT